MKQALGFAAALTAVFLVIDLLAGFRTAAWVGFAAMLTIAAVNSATFLWLWYVRATPLALGMALSWAGQAAITAWWLLGGMPGRPDWVALPEVIFVFLALYIVGGGLHVSVIQRSSESRATALVWPAIALVSVAAGVYAVG